MAIGAVISWGKQRNPNATGAWFFFFIAHFRVRRYVKNLSEVSKMLAWKWPFVRMCGIIGKKRLRKTTNKRVCVLMEKKRIQRANTSKQKKKKTKERTFAYPTVLRRKNNGWLFVVIQLASEWHARYQLRALYKINRVLLLLQFLCDIWIFIDYTVVGRALVELAS